MKNKSKIVIAVLMIIMLSSMAFSDVSQVTIISPTGVTVGTGGTFNVEFKVDFDKDNQNIVYEIALVKNDVATSLEEKTLSPTGTPPKWGSLQETINTTLTVPANQDIGTYDLRIRSGQPGGGENWWDETAIKSNAVIIKKTISGSFTVSDKIYDGDTVATITGRFLNDTIAGDVVVLSGGTAAFNNKNVGVDKLVTGTGFTLSGEDADQYLLASATLTTTADITPKPLEIGGSFTANNKVFDGNDSASILDNNLNLNVVMGSDKVSLANVVVKFDSALVGINIPVKITSAALSGDDAGNYMLSYVNAPTTTANITATGTTPETPDPDQPKDEISAPAATAVANQILKFNNVKNQIGKGKDSINVISAVAKMMGPDTSFNGVLKTDKDAYMSAILQFLNGEEYFNGTLVKPE